MTAAAVAFVGPGKVRTLDAVGTWTGFTSLSLSTVTFVEGTGSLGDKVSATTAQGYGITAADWTGEPWNFASGQTNDGDHIFVWLYMYEGWDTLANGGFRIRIADDLATDSIGTWYVGPQAGYIGGWYAYVINPAANFDAVTAGTAVWTTNGNPAQLTSIDGFGFGWKVLSTISGATDNCYGDAIVVGKGYVITLGDAGSTEGKFSDFITFEENTTSGRFGAMRAVSGLLLAKSKLYIGASSGSTNSEFIDSGFTVVWEKATLSDGSSSAVAAGFYELKFQKASGTTDITLSQGTLKAVSPHTVVLTFSGATSASLTGVNVDRGSTIALDTAVTWIDSVITNSGQITAAGAIFTGNTVSGYTGAADTSVLVWNVATDPDGKLDNCTFVKGTNAHHAIEFGTSSPTTMTIRGITFTSFDAANAANGSVLHIKRTTGTVTINTIGCSGTVSYKTAGATVVIVADPVTAAVNVKNTAGSNIQNARVLLKAATGGPFPFDVTVTIVNSGTTATVTHTAHAMATNDKIIIKSASLQANNGVFSITRIDDNSYTYTMGSTPGSNPTGTIKATFAVLSGLTDASGNITMSRVFSADQPVSGWARYGASPYYKPAALGGSVDSATGYSANALMIDDV